MFDIYCPRHQSRVLLGSRSIDRITNSPDGVVVHWHCHCGAHGSFVTGRRASAARPLVSAA